MDKEQANEILEMARRDRRMRRDVAAGKAEWDIQIDRQNSLRLKEILEDLQTWPAISQVGKKVCEATWLVAQHADHVPRFQQYCLDLMERLPGNEIDQTEIAYLEDRVRVNTDRPQLYGTQFHGSGSHFVPRPIENIGQLEARRARMGLGSFATYKEELKAIEAKRKN